MMTLKWLVSSPIAINMGQAPPTLESEGVFDANDDDDKFPAYVSTSSWKSKLPNTAQVHKYY